MHYFQDSLSGTQLEWYYQLENDRIRTWSDLADAFYRQYEYNAELTPTRMQLQSMSMGRDEKFKEYAQKWRDLASRVQPPLSNRELVDMFIGTLTGPFFNHLIGNSSAEFTELILTGDRIEAGIKSGKIQVESSPNVAKRSFGGKKEANAVYGQKSRVKTDHTQSVGAVVISNPTPAQPQRDNTRNQNAPQRQFTKINMPLSQALQHMMKAELITLRDPPQHVNTSSPKYNPNARCAYHSNSPGHDTNNCWALKNKIQDMIEAREIEFDPPIETPNMINAPMPDHGKSANAIDNDSYVFDVNKLTTPLMTVKKDLLQAGVFPGCPDDCPWCASKSDGCA